MPGKDTKNITIELSPTTYKEPETEANINKTDADKLSEYIEEKNKKLNYFAEKMTLYQETRKNVQINNEEKTYKTYAQTINDISELLSGLPQATNEKIIQKQKMIDDALDALETLESLEKKESKDNNDKIYNQHSDTFIRICHEQMAIFQKEMLKIYIKENNKSSSQISDLFDVNTDALRDENCQSVHFKTLAQEYKTLLGIRNIVADTNNYPDPFIRLQMGCKELNEKRRSLHPKSISSSFFKYYLNAAVNFIKKLANFQEADTHALGTKADEDLSQLKDQIPLRYRR